MVPHMKTTIDIADPLLKEAKRLAQEQDRTLRDVVEDALRRLLADEARPKKPFRLRDESFHGNGLQPGVEWGKWFDYIYPPFEPEKPEPEKP